MSAPFSYSTTYTLDKSHFAETFDESTLIGNGIGVYLKSIILAAFGTLILLFTEVSPYVSWFIVALGALEALSIRFRKPWWLARQMLSKAANSELTLTIDGNAVSSQSYYVQSNILWTDISKIEQTTQGWLLYHGAGKSYISGRCLSEDANEFIRAKMQVQH